MFVTAARRCCFERLRIEAAEGGGKKKKKKKTTRGPSRGESYRPRASTGASGQSRWSTPPPPHLPYTTQSGNSRFCSFPRRKKKKLKCFFRANARKKKRAQKHPPKSKKYQKDEKKTPKHFFAHMREIRPLTSKKILPPPRGMKPKQFSL